MEKHEYLSLFEKHLAGTATLEEEQALKDYQDHFELVDLPWDNHAMGNKPEVKDMLYKKLKSRIIVPKMKLPVYKWSVAAAIVLICTGGLYCAFHFLQEDVAVHKLSGAAVKPVVSGGNKAILKLSNGSEVALGNSSSFDQITDGSATISNQVKGTLVYTNISATEAKAATVFNSISIPRGGQYRVVLPDGTRVILNAASSINFPTRFSGSERRVQLTGEAYFEVAKNAHMPFKVEVKGMEIKVLGTHFNVMAYDDEETINTTLLEGAVELSNDHQKKLLKPGQQAILRKTDGSIGIEQVNTAEFVAWKNGSFLFTDDAIETIMRKISRWYDVDVAYQGNLSDKSFAGSISKYEEVSEVLKMLELTGSIHFKVEGRRITVMP